MEVGFKRVFMLTERIYSAVNPILDSSSHLWLHTKIRSPINIKGNVMRIFILALLLLTGCATTAGYEKVLSLWIGQSADRLISVWGAPKNVTQLSDGGKVLEYSNHRNIQIGGFQTTTPVMTQNNGMITGDVNAMYNGTSTTYVPTTTPVQNIALKCITRFTTNEQGIITNWAWQGNDCKAKDPRQQTQQVRTNPNGKTRAENMETFNKINAKARAVCETPEYAPLFSVSPCDGTKITIVQEVDNNKITQEQKKILLKWRSEIDSIKDERNAFFRSAGNLANKRWADYLDSVQPEIDKYNLDFYNGVITLGQYNRFRKDLTAKIIAEQRRINQP